MRAILFLCTGNYFRSRFAEEWFNHLASKRGLGWRAASAGLAQNCRARNPGPISPHTLAGLRERGVELPDPSRAPVDVTREALERCDRVIALKEAEHRRRVEAAFPELAWRVTYWHVDDVDCVAPHVALERIEQQVATLIDEIERGA